MDAEVAEQGTTYRAVPAWRRVTEGEQRWRVGLAVLVLIGLQLYVPREYAFRPAWVVPALELALLVVLSIANPRRINRRSRPLRVLGLALVFLSGLATAWSALVLGYALIQGTDLDTPLELLRDGGAIWVTNVIVFALWYWEFDRGGPAARAHNVCPPPDFVFPQMTNPELAAPEWEPEFVDYLYLSFTNATAFSPTDVLPMSRWAKLTMMTQSATTLVVMALVIARAVNVLGA
ncbi:hypothetical protein Cs7R123_65430 [Catellatospora sp. TT07R-123]|uniref:hypothetical protein n=1 Tax=Catellatospora sp. TT07R-123 TaxID=2733863 RepID=UPI001B067F66|nr:hypothetical protein [Catellatospora sp. TT07R-123]GHJ49201.1 hypothetical protein Cs7R123_65430 [Catellatospora sp. TT07R-123]